MQTNRTLLFLLSILMAVVTAFGQTQFWSDDFEDIGSPSSGWRTPSNNIGLGDPSTYYFKRTTNSQIDLSFGSYAGQNGLSFWAGENHGGLFGPGNEEQNIVFSNIDISGKTGLTFKGLFAANNQAAAFENLALGASHSDYLIVEYAIDGGFYQPLFNFFANNNISSGTNNKTLAEDLNGDGIGEGTFLTTNFTTFTKTIAGTGTMLTLRIRCSSNGGNEEIAFDYFQLLADACVPPVVTANPPNRYICSGGNTSFGISATGATAYQWQVNAGSGFTDISNGGVYSGTTTSTLTVTGVTAAMAGYSYRCVAMNGTASCSTNSNGATLSISNIITAGSKSDVSCNGGSNGAAAVSASGGVTPYSYSWSPYGGTGSVATGLAAGTYTVTVTDNIGCTATRHFTINQPTTLNVTASSQTNVSCNGASNGAASVNAATGGTPGYTYNWSPGNPIGDGTTSVTGLSAGTWTCTVTDANGCTSAVNFTVSQSTALSLTPSSQTNVSCNGGANGAASVNAATGGAGGYTYNWTPGNPTGDGTTSVTGLSAGTWTCTVTDANACTSSQSFEITEPSVLNLTAASQTNIACNGGANGAASVNAATGGAGGYTYNWTPGNPAGDGTTNVTGLSAGTWTCTVTDANGCTSAVNFNVTQPSALGLTAASQTNVSCFGGSNGAAAVNPATGGAGGYTYNWTPGNPTGDGTTSVTGLSAGTWTCTVTDANGCISSANVTIGEPQPFLDKRSPKDTAITISGNWGGWLNSASNISESNPSGYVFTGLHYYGEVYNSWTKFDVSQVQPNAQVDSIVLELYLNGTDDISVIEELRVNKVDLNNYGPYSAFNSSALADFKTNTYTTVNVSSLGVYSHINLGSNAAKDLEAALSTGEFQLAFDIASPTSWKRFTSSQNKIKVYYKISSQVEYNLCNGDAPGVLDTLPAPTGGNGDILYLWQTSHDGQHWSPAAGTNDSIIYDASFAHHDTTYYRRLAVDQVCEDSVLSENIVVNVPDSIQFSTIPAHVSCNGAHDGSIDLTVTGGAAPYSYLWSNSATTEDVAGLAPGNYSVTVTDKFGCTVSNTYTITEPTMLATSVTVDSNVSCNGLADGGATVAVSGGTLPYIYNWSNGDHTASGGNMTAGKYYITISDANGCTATDSVVITEPATLTAAMTVDSNESCTNFADGGLTVTPSGGTAPYSYYWSNTATTATIAGITAGNYSVTVTDANGCTAVANANIIVQDIIAPTVLVQNINAYLDATGHVTITAIEVDNGTNDVCGLDTLILNKYSFNCSEVGANSVWFKAIDINGNEDSAMATVTVLDTVSPAVITNSITVYLDVNGQASIAVSDINHSSTDACGIDTLYLDTYSFNCANVGANTVALTAIDVNGNSTTETAVITVKDTISPVAATQNITAYLDAAGQATINATYVDHFSNDACGIDTLILNKYNFNCTEIGANTITLTAVDVNGNTSSKTAVVTVLDTISPVIGTQDLTVYLDASGNSTITAADIDLLSADACGIDTLILDHYNFNCGNVGANTVTLTAIDVNGNTSSETALVTVIDTISPVVLTQNVTVYLNAAGQASITTSDVNASTTDACGIAGYSLSQFNFDCSHSGNNLVVLTATDVNGNSTSENAIVEVRDTISPIAITKGITVYLDQNGTVTIPASAVDNGSSDNCSFTLSLSNNTFDCTQTGLNLETFTITDASGNSASKDVLITVKDTISPKLYLHKKITVALDQFGKATISASQLDSASSDNCSNLLFFAASKTSFDCSNLGENLITITAYDNKNNSSSTAIVEVKDYMAPVVSTQNITVYLTASGAVTVPAAHVDNNSADNCTVDSIWLDKSTFGCADLGQNVVKLYAKDQSGNVAVANAVITVADTVSPVVVTKNSGIYLDATGHASISASELNDGSTDNCSVQSLSLSQTSFSCADIGTKNVTLTVTDGSSNQASATAQVTVMDTISPAVVTQNITVTLDAGGNASVNASDIDNGSSDACGIQSLSLDVTSFSCADLGTNTVNLTVIDNHGNTNSNTATVTVVDDIQPVVATQNITIYLDANGDASITPADINNGSTDNCGISNYSLDISVFDCADLGQNLVTLSATDASNNTASKTAFVTVLDTIHPSIDNLPSTITVYAPANQCAASVQWPAITASDNCNITAITTSKANGALFSLGTTSVNVTATDGNGNSVTQSFDVTVVDTVAPVISNVPSNYTVVGNMNSCDAVVNWVEPVALDNCGGISWTKSHLPGAVFPVGNTTVTYTATDNDNNSATITFVVTVTDQVAPVISSIPANITVGADAGSCDAMVNFSMPAVTDNCAGAIITSSHPSGSIFPLGTTTVNFTATDAANNVTSASFTITVEDNQKPVVSNVPANDTVGACGAAYTYALPQATDNCSAVSMVQTSGLPSGSILPAGVTVNTFRISDANGNDTSVSFTIVVVPQGVPTLPGLLEICENSQAVEMTLGQDLSWSGNGIINGTTFDPAAAGTGRHKLEYTFDDEMGCTVTGNIYVTVLPQPVKPVITKTGSTTLTTGNYVAYQWYRDGVEIAGATSQSLTYSSGGNYQVMVMSSSGCENYSDGIIVGQANGGIGIKEDLFGNLELYPNPSSGLITIDLNRVQLQELQVSVFNTAGKKVFELHEQTSQEGKVTLDLSHLPDAAYFIQIRSAAETVVKRVVLY